MIRSLMILVLLCLLPSLATAETARQEQTAIYGDDDRVEYFESTDEEIRQVSRESVVALMSGYRIDHSDPRGYHAPRLGQAANLCRDEPFWEQPAASFCSGVLIAPDLVLTAGHCIWDEKFQCQRTRFVFNYRYTSEGQLAPHSKDETYSCREVITHTQSTTTAGLKDWAIIQLDRPVSTTQQPALLRSSYHRDAGANFAPTPMIQGEKLVMLGFPLGVPLKFDEGGRVRNPRPTLRDAFVTTVDAFGGNSGSGVWHRDASGQLALAGILVSGDQDFVDDTVDGRSCKRSNICSSSGCAGENVIYLDRIIADFCMERGGKRINHPLCGFTEPLCGDSFCDYSERHGAEYCTPDCGPMPALSICGDGYCSEQEFVMESCPRDCQLQKPPSDSCDAVNFGTFDGCHSCPTGDPDCDLKSQSGGGGLDGLFNCQSADPAQTTAFGVISFVSFAGLLFLARRRRRSAA